MTGIRARGRALLATIGLLGWLRRAKRARATALHAMTDRDARVSRRLERERFTEFAVRYGPAFAGRFGGTGSGQTALLVARGFPAVEMNLCLLRALQIAGYRVTVLLQSERGGLHNYFRLAGADRIVRWSRFAERYDFSREAAATVDSCPSIAMLRDVVHRGIRVGRSTVSTTLRSLRVGKLDLHSQTVRRALAQQLAAAMAAAEAMAVILDSERPALMLTTDVEYVPGAEQFESCLARGIEVIKYARPHCPNALMFKRYGPANMDQDPSSLSDQSWELMREVPWERGHSARLHRELETGYAEGNWYGSGVELRPDDSDPEALRRQLRLTDAPSAFVFPHVAWDASLRWGRDLFEGYEDWFIETMRAAYANDAVNWIVKIHPAHARKNRHEGRADEPAEVVALYRELGPPPPHVTMIPAESHINTWSLFPLMDFCVTVRGTVGMEAALRGIPVLTAGTGRYDGRGFTIDSETRDEYLSRLARIQELERIGHREQNLAERFAYGIFLLRPFRFETVRLEPDPENPGSRHAIPRLAVTSPSDWSHARDIAALARWISSDGNPDFMISFPGA